MNMGVVDALADILFFTWLALTLAWLWWLGVQPRNYRKRNPY